ncbi:3',5'-cyclic adenosine monophosphate phosphodiesterase CpdA [Roseibium aquae]|uniref:3',5'-cyclic adenosine monophosphate phosphodiesterase CpdA n=1 Tax=Roseibium aquae TaxID=1323746 RepID=A0A916WZ59_9HYPH|nr:phosphodiesterase [Roseibium aquae]GGB44488.1 3',5'-cyclic adenosine monophosphate phosphodiesterase CpdA [Roseibium aquae]
MTLLAQITDLHLRPRGLACYRVSDTNMFAERAVHALLALPQRPDAVIVTGDLTDRDDPREYALARTLLGRLPMPVYVLPGNHDSSAGMRQSLHDFPGIVDLEPDQGKIHYTVDAGDLRIVGLDTHVPGQPYGELGSAQISWLDRVLGETERPTVIALHHPPAATGITHMDDIGLRDTEAFAAAVSRHAHVQRILCGHVHRPIVTSFAGTIMTLAPSTAHQIALDFSPTAPAMFNFEPPAYFLHQLGEGGTLTTHLAYIEHFPGPHHFFADDGVTWPGDEGA